MSLLRLIARLDIKGANVVKGVQLEGLRVVGKPEEMAQRYAESGADEILYIDTVASLYGRNQLEALLEKTVESVFVPITVGGGIASVQDARRLFNAGADKIAINTAALKRPALINELAEHFGSQAVVVSIEAKRIGSMWECYTDSGRNRTGKSAVQWGLESCTRGAGEILITSVDRDGTRRGFDTELVAAIAPHVPVPVTASGGCGSLEHLKAVLRAGADAVAVGSALHYGKVNFLEMRAVGVEMSSKGLLRHPLTLLERPRPGVAEIPGPE
ncbi:MAG: imidazole glycerol phosphate synthase cyclase subunit [Candidatus Nanopelagicales bacterium]|nr:imidazole glycerol phosphate synthase cyclase subunit [Candidatus Nanopelagicales bacterium]